MYVHSNPKSTAESADAPEEPKKEEVSLGKKIFDTYVKVADVATTLFPLWTVICSGIALKSPSSFAWFTTEYFTAGLAALMLSMGITLTPQDFIDVAKEPVAIGMQFSLCYAMMPLLAYGLAKAFNLNPALLAGMVLVGSINGGQASNLCTYIAKGNVALSVLMTTATTIGAIFMTPILCKAFLGAVVPVDAAGIAMSTIQVRINTCRVCAIASYILLFFMTNGSSHAFGMYIIIIMNTTQVVLAPIAIGMATNKFFPGFVKKILPFAPVVGVVSTCLLVASAVAQVAEPIISAGLSLQVRHQKMTYSCFTLDTKFPNSTLWPMTAFCFPASCSSIALDWWPGWIFPSQVDWILRSFFSYHGN